MQKILVVIISTILSIKSSNPEGLPKETASCTYKETLRCQGVNNQLGLIVHACGEVIHTEDISYPRYLRKNQLEERDSSDSDLNSLYSNISLEIPIGNNTEMADALRSTVTLLKTFDGTPSHLETFIQQINTFHTRYFNNDAAQQEYVILAIKSKIIKEAEDFLLTRPDLDSWHEIKNALRQKFSDPITRANLQQQLSFSSRPKNESTQDYILKLKALVTKINTKIYTEVSNLEARNILITQNELTATQNLLANITSELRTLLIVQNPQNLDIAIDIITNYEILTSQSHFKNNFIQNHTSTRPNIQKPTNFPLSTNFQRTIHSQPQFPGQPIIIRQQQPIIRQQLTNNNPQSPVRPMTRPQAQFPRFNQNSNQINQRQFP
ncbi:hypothetical protein ABEB36_015774 [Hypothenemus hampei]|uniref:Retrotransposon gag domain-containing protein n=1 Tax=Hypothenemus hampei TaxID=57062 RepID=A0ABD1DZK0_HYPHA